MDSINWDLIAGFLMSKKAHAQNPKLYLDQNLSTQNS